MQHKWQTDISTCKYTTDSVIWKEAYLLPFKVTKSTKLIKFQFKLLHKRLPTNSYLYKIKIKDNENCSFGKIQKEEIMHLFCNCEHVTLLWKRIDKMLKRQHNASRNFNINITMVLGLKQSTSRKHFLLSFCFVVARNYIWNCHTNDNKPIFKAYLYQLKKYCQMECSKNENLCNEIKAMFPSFNL